MQNQNLLKRMLFSEKKLRRLAALLPFILLAETSLTIALAHLFREGIDKSMLGGVDFMPVAIGLLVVIVANLVLGYCRSRVVGSLSENATADLRAKTTERFAYLPIGSLEKMHSGDSLSKLTNDLQAVKGFLDTDGYFLISRPLLALAALTYMLFLSWQLTLVCLIFVPLLMFSTAKISAPLQAYSKSLQEELGRLNQFSQDILSGMEVVKAFNLEEKLSADFAHQVGETVEKGKQIAVRRAFLSAVSLSLSFLPFIVPMGIGSLLTARGVFTAGRMLAFVNLLNNLTFPLGRLPNHWASYKAALGSLERVYEIVDMEPERETGKHLITRSAQVVEFSQVDFAYNSEPVLEDLSFSVARGERVAIVGPSGSGKSTIFKLITGFYEHQGGEIFLFGQPIGDWNLQALRSHLAVVSQDTFLFPATVRENIALGRDDIPLEAIVAAAQKANAHEFILSLPQGYDTLVGERGSRLSGGQRQRLAIARAILYNAELLLLDEATSALDTEAEYMVQQALEAAMEGKTSIIIAHRLSTIQNADRILVLDQGRVVEEGTHQELLRWGGLYAKLYETSGVA